MTDSNPQRQSVVNLVIPDSKYVKISIKYTTNIMFSDSFHHV